MDDRFKERVSEALSDHGLDDMACDSLSDSIVELVEGRVGVVCSLPEDEDDYTLSFMMTGTPGNAKRVVELFQGICAGIGQGLVEKYGVPRDVVYEAMTAAVVTGLMQCGDSGLEFIARYAYEKMKKEKEHGRDGL